MWFLSARSVFINGNVFFYQKNYTDDGRELFIEEVPILKVGHSIISNI